MSRDHRLSDDRDPRSQERRFDVVTLILAGLLAAILLGAIGFGMFVSRPVTASIPSVTTGRGVP